MTSNRIVLIAITVLTAVVVTVVLLTGGGEPAPTPSAGPTTPAPTPTDTPTDAPTTAGAMVIGDALPRHVADATDPTLGTVAPLFSGPALDGSGTITVDPATDGPQLLVFLAHWCPHCQREAPVVQTWLDEGRLPAEVTMTAIATSIDPTQPNYPPDAWLDGIGWTPSTVEDDERSVIAAAYGLSALPYWVALDAEGRVVARAAGELPPAQLDALAALAAG